MCRAWCWGYWEIVEKKVNKSSVLVGSAVRRGNSENTRTQILTLKSKESCRA